MRVWVECLMRLFYKSGISYSGGGGLRTIEDWVLQDLNASMGRGWVRGGNGVFAM